MVPRRRKDDAAHPPLSAEKVFAAAIALADEKGIGGVSMRKLAATLGVEAMSLYHHVKNKSALLDGMIDAVFAEMGFPVDRPWREGMVLRARAQHRTLLRHPWAVGLVESREEPGFITLQHHDRSVLLLRTAGFSPRLVGHTLAVVDSYVYGFVVQELNLPFDTSEEVEETASNILEAAGEHIPNLAWLAQTLIMQPGYAFSKEFEVGLALILEGIERWHAAEPG